MAARLSPGVLLLCLACWTIPVQAGEPSVVRSKAQLDEVLASGRPTPLDALTPYGKRRLLRGIVWRDKGMGGFSATQLVRELDASQIGQVLAFFDLAAYAKGYSENLSGAPVRLPPPSGALEAQLDRFEQLYRELDEERAPAADASSARRMKPMVSYYDTVFAGRMKPAALRRQAPGDLPALFDAALLASNLDPASPATGHLLSVHREMAARGIDTRRGFDDSVLYGMLAARRFEEARSFAAGRPHLGKHKIPTVVDTLGTAFSGRSLYEYDAGKDVLVRRADPPPAGVELVMVVGAGCHFSRDALAALRANPVLLARLRQANLKLLISPREPIPFWYLAEWNAANPTLPLRVAYDTKEWILIAEANTPEFFLLEDGKPAGHVIGWPKDGNAAALLALLDTARD